MTAPSKNKYTYLIALIVTATILNLPIDLYAQDDLMKDLEEQEKKETQYVGQTFKGSRLVNGQSVETRGKGELEVIFQHRFGALNSGSYNLWGMDEAVMRMGFEYGITDRLGISLGRSSSDKTFDGYLKYKIARQSKGLRNFPFTITAVGSGTIKTSPKASDNPDVAFTDRLAYVGEILIARKISSGISVQVTPVFVHRNSVSGSYENNDDMAIGFGGRYKLTRSFTLTAEYFYRINPHENTPYYNALGFGFDIETGGHVFQMVFTNSLGMIDRTIITETTDSFKNGGIHFGFNITRSFSVGKKKM
ncbi:MAG TPA: DUF5777 family beta-barrel protein [Cyclobacteriaceae bacterium]|nr:DUF5777 family beta-barrel protein [Cyclobacteriaceae bacterium]